VTDNAGRLIEALIGVDQARARKSAEQRAEQERKASYVVTVSRSYGSLGRLVAEELGSRLGVAASDREILEAVARRAAVDVELVARLDETARYAGLRPWMELFRVAPLNEQRYYDILVNVIMNIARRGGIIVGRGAHLILGPRRAFRVRIDCSLETCARRIAERDHLDLEHARERVLTVDREREGFVRQFFGVDHADNTVYDMVLNSDRFDVCQMVDLILHGMHVAGYDILDTAFSQDCCLQSMPGSR
jgi:cytidylate kinase